MVNFETFTELAKERIADSLDGVSVESIKVEKIKKTNQELTGLYVMRDGEYIAPNVFLDGFYDMYSRRNDLEDALCMIADEYKEAYEKLPNVDPNIASKEYFFEKVFITLVNRNMNEGMLAESPYMDIEGMPELAGVYSVIVEMNDEGYSSMRLKNSYMEDIGITAEDIAEIALENTKRIFPTRIKPMEEMLQLGFPGDESDEKIPDSDLGMYVITNSRYTNGAVGVLDKESVSELADKLDSNIMLVPSSTHEFIAVADGIIPAENIAEMVREINRDVVSLNERLSDNVFVFDRDTREYSQVTHFEMRLDEDISQLVEKVV